MHLQLVAGAPHVSHNQSARARPRAQQSAPPNRPKPARKIACRAPHDLLRLESFGRLCAPWQGVDPSGGRRDRRPQVLADRDNKSGLGTVMTMCRCLACGCVVRRTAGRSYTNTRHRTSSVHLMTVWRLAITCTMSSSDSSNRGYIGRAVQNQTSGF